MKEFCLVHLSDLHIDSNEDPNLVLVREGISEDLNKIITKNKLKIDALAVTGDIINRGNNKSYEMAKNAVRDIMSDLKLEKEDLVMVPGNHDIPRSDFKEGLMLKLKDGRADNLNFVDSDWNYFKIGFNDYIKFKSEMSDESDYSKETFGVKVIEKNDVKVNFIELNTAWTTMGNEDYGNLYIGRWQLEAIKKQLNSEESYDLSIALTHHPLDWLKSEERELLKDYLSNKSKIGADVILHGHVHDGELSSESTPDGSLLHLVSGIGYPENYAGVSGQPKLAKCRYSIYKFNIENNTVECWCRVSNKDGNFKPDTSLYSNCTDDGRYLLKMKQNLVVKEIENLSEEKLNTDLELDPVPVTAGWTGRGVELNKMLNSNYSVAVISGVGGQGKSWLAAEFLKRHAKAGNSDFEIGLWINCRELPDTIHLKLVEIMEVLSEKKETIAKYRDEKIEDTIIRFYGYLKKHKILLVFDNIDAYVDIKNQQIINELSKVLDMALENEHNSLILMTCRIPITDNRANFLPIHLNGLSDEDGIDFFKNRNIPIKTSEDIEYCKKIINHIKGHPWWLGLIAGQIHVNNFKFKKCYEQLKTEGLEGNPQVEKYFASIWEGLKGKVNGICQDIIRHLVESPYPLSEDQIHLVLTTNNFKDVNRALTRIRNLGLLEWHEDKNGDILYQVHPLVREFVHGSYSVEKQKSFVCKVLYLFLSPKLVNMLFYDRTSFENELIERSYGEEIKNAIDTCLNSRNYVEALELMTKYCFLLKDNGFHLDIVHLGKRILEEIDWKKEQVATVRSKANFLASLIDLLSLLSYEKEMNTYLKKYELFVIPNTLPYSLFLSISVFLAWRSEDYKKANEYFREYDELAKNFQELWEYQDMRTNRALILRETGNYKEALNIFDESGDCGDKFGNMGRCYQKMGRAEEALNYYRKSLRIFRDDDSFISNYNKGYALFWIAEILYDSDNIYESYLCLDKAKKIWEEYAPALLSNLIELDTKLESHTIIFDDLEKEVNDEWNKLISEQEVNIIFK